MAATSSPDRSKGRIAVFGAGLIGCYIGGRLARAGADVTLIGRESAMRPIRERGLRLTDLHGADIEVAPGHVQTAEEASALAGASLVIVAVKSPATEDAARAIAAHAPTALVLSLQNGVSNAAKLAAALPEARVVAGMVPYNVASPQPGHYHQGTGGQLLAGMEPEMEAWLPVFAKAGIPLALRQDMREVLWGKLVVNLNNAINALSGVPLMPELAQRDFRRALALCQAEALSVLKHANIKPADVLGAPLWLMPHLMRLPTWAYRRVMARQGLKIDRHARSSMAEDLAAGRTTEVDFLNGEVVALAHGIGHTAPINERVVELVLAAEKGAQPWKAEALLTALKSAGRARNIKRPQRRGA